MKKAVLITLGVAAVGVAGYYAFGFAKPDETVKLTKTLTPTPKPLPQSWGLGHDRFPLQLGSYGQNVKNIQAWSNRLGSQLQVDGKFGTKTQAAMVQHINSKVVGVMQYDYLRRKAGV